MLFSLFRNENTLGEARYGLACSEIIDCTDNARLIIPLVTYCRRVNFTDEDDENLCH